MTATCKINIYAVNVAVLVTSAVVCVLHPELCTETARDCDLLHSSPNSLQKKKACSQKKQNKKQQSSSTEVKKEGLKVFKY